MESNRVTCICGNCGAQFLEHPSRIAVGRGKFCSKSCMYAARTPRPVVAKVERTCEQCGTTFEVWQSRAKQGLGRFCSEDCRVQGNAAARAGVPRKPNYCVCEHCGASFHVAPSLVAQGQGKHCSRACYAESQSTKGRISPQGYRVISVEGERIGEHRHVWQQANGPIPRGMVIHHRNGDKTDNQLENLELMTRAQHARHHRE